MTLTRRSLIAAAGTATLATPGRILPSAGDPSSTDLTRGSELNTQRCTPPPLRVQIAQFSHSRPLSPMSPRGVEPSGQARAS